MRLIAFFSLAAALTMAGQAATTFTVDPAQSSVTLSGATVGGAPLSEQGPGSLTTRFDGNVQVDLSASQITITGGAVDARTNGVWQPAAGGGNGSAPADFGLRAATFFGTILASARNIGMELSSTPAVIQNNQFSAASVVFTFPEGSPSALDFNGGFVGSGSRSLAGESTNRTATVGSITGEVGSRVLTIAIDTTFYFDVAQDDDTTFTIRGQIVAREGDTVPNPTGPVITRIQVANNQVTITATGTTASAHLRSSTNLTAWADKTSQVAVVSGDTRTFTVPVTGPREFYRIAQ